MDGTLIGTTTRAQSEPGSNSNEGALNFPQSSRIGVVPLDFLVSCSGLSLQCVVEVYYPSAEMQSVQSTAPGDGSICALRFRIGQK